VREFRYIPIGQIVEPENPMRVEMNDELFADLVGDIKRQGVLEPLLVMQEGDIYRVAAGHRRLLAARQAGLDKLPCIVHQPDEDDALSIMIAENIFREDVSPAEEGQLFLRMFEQWHFTEDEVVRRSGKKLGYINARIDLVRGDPDIAAAVHLRLISLGVAAELNKVKSEAYRRVYLERARQGGTTIELAKQWVAQWRMNEAGTSPAQAQPLEPLPSEQHVEQGLRCRICQGTDHQEELEPIWIHRAELYAILSAQRMIQAQQFQPPPEASGQ